MVEINDFTDDELPVKKNFESRFITHPPLNMVSTFNEHEIVNQFTSLSVSSTSTNPRTRTQTDDNQPVSFFYQLRTLPSIHECHVEPNRTESLVSGVKKKKARIEEYLN